MVWEVVCIFVRGNLDLWKDVIRNIGKNIINTDF